MEVWKDIAGYEDLYKVSDLGRVMSLRKNNNQILKSYNDSQNYATVKLYKDKKSTNFKVHRLVWETFNYKTTLQIDHIKEGDKSDNRLCNLQALNNRQNNIKHRLTTKKTSQYTGVSWDKKANKWVSFIRIKGKSTFLGNYINELDASKAYSDKLKEVL
jgi:hypothetical protein